MGVGKPGTPISVVREMLNLAKVGPEDVLYDLGCGDGRFLFIAVEEFDVKKAVGYEINESLINTMRGDIKSRGLENRIEVIHGDLFHADLSSASVVTIHQPLSMVSKLESYLRKGLRGEARVIINDAFIRKWVTAKGSPPYYTVESHKIYLYELPTAHLNPVPPSYYPERTFSPVKDYWR